MGEEREWDERLIEKSMPKLIETTECNDSLLQRLRAGEVLSYADVDELTSIPKGIARSTALYDKLRKKYKPYDEFLAALDETRQTYPFNILKKIKPVGQSTPTVVATILPQPSSSTQVQYVHPQAKPTASKGMIPMNTPSQDAFEANPKGTDSVDFIQNMNPLEVTVKRPTRRMAFPDDYYELREDDKGYALIINITKFHGEDMDRNGGRLDSHYMSELWSQLGYHVTLHEGEITRNQIKQILEDFKQNFLLKRNTSCVVFIGSHGSFSKIITSDHQELNLIRDIIYKFDSKNCPELNGRPKIFLIQACQKFRTGTDSLSVPDRTEEDKLQVPIDHAIVCFSTTPGYVSNRDKFLGTWFAYCLAKVFMENAFQTDLHTMLKMIQDTMRNIDAQTHKNRGQLATHWDMGIQKLYFNMYRET